MTIYAIQFLFTKRKKNSGLDRHEIISGYYISSQPQKSLLIPISRLISMLHVIKNKLECCESTFYVIARLLIGFMFFAHGAQKIFGWYGGKSGAALFSLMGVAGWVEIITGILILVGLWTRLAAFFAAGQMLVAYFMVHAGGGWNPLVNKGELALLYFAAFLLLLIHGNGPYSLEKFFSKKERF